MEGLNEGADDNDSGKKRAARIAAAVLGATLLAGFATTTAQAAEDQLLLGNVYKDKSLADAELPGLEEQCRKSDRRVFESSVESLDDTEANAGPWRAEVLCGDKRGV